MAAKEQWRIDLDREIKAEKKSKHCICGREKVIGELFCDECAEEARILEQEFLRYELPYLQGRTK